MNQRLLAICINGHPIEFETHVAFLGAQPPAVEGLKDIEFAEGDAAGAVQFSEITDPTHQEQDSMSDDLKTQLAEVKARLQAEEEARVAAEAKAADATKRAERATAEAASFAEKARTERTASFVSFAEAQVKAGRLLPKDKAMTVATLGVLADSAPVEFAEGDSTRKVSPSQWLQELIAGGKPQISFGEHAPGNAGVSSERGKSDAEIDAAAHAYARQHKVSYAEALTAVTSFTD